MFIESLKLKNYRNYEEVEINFDKNINIIYGDNAEGKTNLLEAIYMCSTSKSHKNVKDNEIINFQKEEAHIKLIFYNVLETINKNELKKRFIDIQLNKESKKGIAIDGVKIDKVSAFLGLFNVVMFAPEDLNIIKDGPSARRKFLDIEICKIDKMYVSFLANYNKVLNQRNALLRDIKQQSGNNKEVLISMIDSYDEQIIKYGAEIIKKRRKNIEELDKKINDIHYSISGKREKVYINYESIDEREYRELLTETRELDLKNQFTFVGPHRDDISFVIDEKDIRKFGSQGQKKTAAISLKLSELEILREKNNEPPVLLLDDVFSELDENRQKTLVQNLAGIQTIITCTGMKKNIYDILNPNKIFKVSKGEIITVNI